MPNIDISPSYTTTQKSLSEEWGIAMTSSYSEEVSQLDLRALRLGMSDTFSKEEFQIACFDLEIPYDSLPGDALENKVVGLISYARRRGRLQDVVAYVQAARPNVRLSQHALTVPTGPGTLEEQRAKHRRALREDRRDIYLVHTLRPSPVHPWPYDILIYLVPHKDAKLSTVSYAEFFLGKGWDDHIYRAANEEGFVGISVNTRGPFLCTCRVVFQDNHETLLDRYIDFEMADSFSTALARGGDKTQARQQVSEGVP